MEPVTERGRRTRGTILDAAAALMVQRGVEATAMDAVITAAGVSKSQLYHYFDDKAALVRGVIDQQSQQVIDSLSEQLAMVETWPDLRRFFDQLYEFHHASGCLTGCPIGTLAGELAGRDPAAAAALATTFVRWETEIDIMLRRLTASGLLAATTDTGDLATSTLAIVQGGLLLAKTIEDPSRLRVALDAAYELIEAKARTTRTRARPTA